MTDHNQPALQQDVWQVLVGCVPQSPGCKHCFAQQVQEPFRGRRGHVFGQGFDVVHHARDLDRPLRAKQAIFWILGQSGDPFLPVVSDDILDAIFDVIEATRHRHFYGIQTRLPERAVEFIKRRGPLEHVVLRTSVETPKYLHRIDAIREAPCLARTVHFSPIAPDCPMFPAIDFTGITSATAHALIVEDKIVQPKGQNVIDGLAHQAVAAGIPFSDTTFGCSIFGTRAAYKRRGWLYGWHGGEVLWRWPEKAHGARTA